MYENIQSLLSRCIETAEFLCEAEDWKGYIISFSKDQRFVLCPLTKKKRKEHEQANDIVVVMKRKRKK